MHVQGYDTSCAETLAFERQRSWERGWQGNRRSVHQADGRTIYALDTPAFRGGNVDNIRPGRIHVGDQTDLKEVWKRLLKDVDRAALST